MTGKFSLFLFILTILQLNLNAQGFNKFKSIVKETMTGSSDSGNLSEDVIAQGLKEALTRGIELGVDKVSKPDGYFLDPDIKIFLPEEAREVESTLRKLGLGDMVDDAVESLNRAAEDAASGALEIFKDAIVQMTITDAVNILHGEKDAATDFLERTTRAALYDKFSPVIGQSLDKVDATKYWDEVFSRYNKIPLVKDVNPDLNDHVTNKALDGLFTQIRKQEKEIRDNPGARVTDLLKKVFGN